MYNLDGFEIDPFVTKLAGEILNRVDTAVSNVITFMLRETVCLHEAYGAQPESVCTCVNRLFARSLIDSPVIGKYSLKIEFQSRSKFSFKSKKF